MELLTVLFMYKFLPGLFIAWAFLVGFFWFLNIGGKLIDRLSAALRKR